MPEEIDMCVDTLRFFAGAARQLDGRAAGEYLEDHTSFVRREPIGVVAAITPVELPAHDGVVESGPGARRRQRPGAQTVRADATHDHRARRDRGGPPSARCAAGRLRHRDRSRCRARLGSPCRAGVAHRVREHGTRGCRRSPRTTSPACTSSSAARRRWWCSTMRTSTRWSKRSPWPATAMRARTAPRRAVCSRGPRSTTTWSTGSSRPPARSTSVTRATTPPSSGP